ncbi:ABC transporter permease [Bacteroidota bacterium]
MNKSSKIFTIIRHEYLTKTKTKGFVIGTILAPLAIIIVISVIVFVTILSNDIGIKKIAVLDKSGLIGQNLVNADTARYYLTDKPKEELTEMVFSEQIDGFLYIPENLLEENIATVYTRGGGGITFIQKIQSLVSYFTRVERLKKEGLEPEVIDIVQRNVKIETEKITEEGIEKDYTESYAFLGYILGFAIYMFMFIYGSFVSRGVIEEKANRIIEVIASSAKPFEIMMGKVVGIGLVGLTQILFWIILSVGLIYAGQPILMHFLSDPQMMAQGMMTSDQMQAQAQFAMLKGFISPGIIVAFIFYFLSGYFLFSTLFAGIGSAVDHEQDAQQLMMPVSMLIIIPMLFIFVVMSNPDSVLSVILSLIPFFAPILMTVRIAATEVPVWQLVSSVVLIISTFIFAVWVASRIYRVGILMYGKKPSLKDLIKWIRLAG